MGRVKAKSDESYAPLTSLSCVTDSRIDRTAIVELIDSMGFQRLDVNSLNGLARALAPSRV
jgi:oligoribonuclease (3'-5' exoribonuclease)